MKIEQTVASLIQKGQKKFTRSERQLATKILENYPVSGLGSITSLSKVSKVSNPTIVRLAKKLGFSGFAQLQSRLRAEVEATISNPIMRHDRWAESVPDTHLLNRFADAAMQNIRQTLAQINPGEFDTVATLLSDKSRHIHIAGGRITHSLADYLFTHLQMIRDGLTLIPPNMSTWPHYILSMKPNDILIVFDIRRYELEISRLSDSAKTGSGYSIVYRSVGLTYLQICEPLISFQNRGAIRMGFQYGDHIYCRGHYCRSAKRNLG